MSGPSLTRNPAPVASSAANPSAGPVVLRPAIAEPALTTLARLAVRGRAPKTGYARARFGNAWSDDSAAELGGNGCDTRDDLLRAQLAAVLPASGCEVTSGVELDPYTGVVLRYLRTDSAVDIDHVVALGDAWQTGAQRLSVAQRLQLANDPLNLLTVSLSANRQKGDADAASWLPKAKGYRCAYVARQVAVKYRYALWVTAAEAAAVRAVLASCPQQPAPIGIAPRAAAPTGAGQLPPTSAPPTSQPPTSPPASQPSTSQPAGPQATGQSRAAVYYPNCAAVRAAGAAPLHRADPGYRSGLDGDGDGIACEH